MYNLGMGRAFRPPAVLALPVFFILVLRSCSANWAFLPDQSGCRLDCLNGGVCAFLRQNPEQHKCICMIGMFTGERCERKLNEEEEAVEKGGDYTTTTTQSRSSDEAGGAAWDSYEEELALDDGAEEGIDDKDSKQPGEERLAVQSRGPKQFVETNTMPFEEFAEPQRQPAVPREELYEEQARKESRQAKKKKRPKAERTGGQEGGDGAWMMARKGERRVRSGAPSTAPERPATAAMVVAWLLAIALV